MLSVLLAALLAQATSQISDAEVREKANAYLGAIDRAVSADQWRALGPRAAEVLEPIASDPQALPTRRAQAIDGLAAAAPARAAAIAPRLARDAKQPLVVRVAAVHATGGVSANAVAELKPVLQGAHAGLRAEAAEVLSRHGGCAAVKKQAARETERPGAWRRALARCQ
ncbi:MAG TPA: hypothetical protein VLW85_16470 [Myxococcales bacterium]|nr:hypothetical protein [Myxococcales bacterium]